jgi:outer membrane receptor protein involved in Fe transport
MQLPTRILLLALAVLATASAQNVGGALRPDETSTAPVKLDPVVVTADLWASPLTRIPASVTVVDEAALRSGAVRHFGDLVDQIPNLTWTGGTARPRYLQIRGLGENSQYEGETPDSAVRFLVDDLDFTGLGGLAGAFDVQQVEVLRGPQAGAFGANAAGGVVRLVTAAPTPFWTGRVETSVGGYGHRSGGFALGGPLSPGDPEKFKMRLSLQRAEGDGFRHNVTLNRATNARAETTARLRLEWNPNAAWRWESTLLHADLDAGFDEFALDNNGGRTFSDQPGRDEQRSLAASLRGTRSSGGVRFSTVTSVARTRSRYAYDDDWTAASYRGFSDLHRSRWVVNQELRLDSAEGLDGWIDRWTLGAFYSDTGEWTRYTNEDPGNLRGLRTVYNGANAALFGQASHGLSPRTRLVAGLRLERVEYEGRGQKTRFRKTRGTFDPVVEIAPAFRDTMAGGKVSLEHDLGACRLAFASVTRGYKAGGVNVDARLDPGADPLSYGTETLWNFEAGLRGAWFEQRLTGEATVFHLVRRDTQVRDSAGFGGNYRFFTDNADGARVTGLEGAAAWAFADHWSLRGSLSLMDSALGRFTLANGNTGGGRRLANTPRHGYTLALRRDAPRGFFGSAEWVGRATQFDSNNQNEARRAFRVVNLAAGYAWRQWTLTLWARNALDETYDKRVFFFGNAEPDFIETRYEDRAAPRQVGATLAYRF